MHFESDSEIKSSLRALRLWHYRQVLACTRRERAVRALGHVEVAGWYSERARVHESFWLSLNPVFNVGDGVLADHERIANS